jgi:hypothetical protein
MRNRRPVLRLLRHRRQRRRAGIANGPAGFANGDTPALECGGQHGGVASVIRSNQAGNGVRALSFAPALECVGYVRKPRCIVDAHPDRCIGDLDQRFAECPCWRSAAISHHQRQRCVAANVARQRIQRRVDGLKHVSGGTLARTDAPVATTMAITTTAMTNVPSNRFHAGCQGELNASQASASTPIQPNRLR